jgi:beta-glucosidase
MSDTEFLTFPKDFVWGTATAAYQIEGAADADGKGESVWDRFCSTPGKIDDSGDRRIANDGRVACDHYRRWKADLDLMASLGLKAYRFSLSWPRILPLGSGSPNPRGLEFYDRLVDGMLERGIRPFATLFHWDLPQALQDRGGWASRGTIDAFLAYADCATRRLGDRVKDWMTINEPWVYAFCGHLFGAHAPGLRDLKTTLAVAHNLLVAHGRVLPVVRTNAPGARVGIVDNLEWIEPATGRPEDLAAAKRHDGAFNRWFLDPIFGRGYPPDMVEWYGVDMPIIEPGDLEAMAAPVDFLGVNYYTRRIMRADPAGRGTEGRSVLAALQVRWPFSTRADFEEWEIAPEGLYRLLLRVAREYPSAALFVTENGMSWPDAPSPDGQVHDPLRVSYIARHLAAVRQAVDDGVPVKGYFLWSFMDNFEWAFGFTKRFGITWVDYATQERVVKDSGKWYSAAARAGGFPREDSEREPAGGE